VFTTGKVGQAFNFNGSSFITMGNPAALNLADKQVTIAGWINPASTAKRSALARRSTRITIIFWPQWNPARADQIRR